MKKINEKIAKVEQDRHVSSHYIAKQFRTTEGKLVAEEMFGCGTN